MSDCDESKQDGKTMRHANRRNLYLITLCVSVAFMALGVSSAWPTPVLPKFRNNETKVEISTLLVMEWLMVNLVLRFIQFALTTVINMVSAGTVCRALRSTETLRSNTTMRSPIHRLVASFVALPADRLQAEVAVMFSVYPVGFAAGSLATRFIADTLGRRATILGSAIPIAIGSLILVFATNAWLLYVTAFLWQYGTGMISTVIGYYLSEIADKDIRATLQVITSFTFKFGNLLMMTIGTFLSYDTLNYIMVTLPLSFFIVCWWIPETPYFCLKAGNVDGARKSLRTLRRYKNEADLEDELKALKSNVRDEMSHSSTIKELFTGLQYRKALIIAAGLKMTQIMTGGVLIRQYLGWIMAETKIKIDMALLFIIYGCVTFTFSMISSILVDRMGRRPLLIYSYVGTGLSLGLVAVYFFLQDLIGVDPTILTAFSFMPFTGILLSTVLSTLGFNSLIYIIPAEIFPMNVKAIAMTSLNIFGCVLAFISAQGYQVVKDHCGLTTIFSIFALVAIGGGIFSYHVVTETKGKDLRDIQLELQGPYYTPVAIHDKDDEKNCKKENDVELDELTAGDKHETGDA